MDFLKNKRRSRGLDRRVIIEKGVFFDNTTVGLQPLVVKPEGKR